MLCLKINGFGGFKVANKISFFMKTLFILFEMVILHGGLHSLFTISLIIIDNYLGVIQHKSMYIQMLSLYIESQGTGFLRKSTE